MYIGKPTREALVKTRERFVDSVNRQKTMHTYLVENAIVYGIIDNNPNENSAHWAYKDAVIDFGLKADSSDEEEYKKLYCGDWSSVRKSTLLAIAKNVDYLSEIETIKVKGRILEFFYKA